MSQTKTKLNDFLPDKTANENSVIVQAKVPPALRKRAAAILKARHLTWNDLIVAAMKQLVFEEDH